MKFFIYNPEPRNYSNPSCCRFHSQTRDPSHIFDCYRRAERSSLNFLCSDRILKLSEPHPRHTNKKYEKSLRPRSRTYTSKKVNVSTRLDHLAAPIFRRVYTNKQNVESHCNVTESVKQNLNLHIQRSMYNIYSRLQNVKFPNIMDSTRDPRRKSIKASAELSAEEYENRLKLIERLSQPRKIPLPEQPALINDEKRPVNMESIERLSMPRKIKSEQIIHKSPSRPLQSPEYYEKLSQPRKPVEEIKKPEPKLTSLQRTNEMAVPLPRLQRRKFMKGDNEKYQFPVSRAALQYTASAKINKLAVPKKVPEDPNQRVTKSKKRK